MPETAPGSAASDVPDLGKPFCTRCHKWGHRYTECPEPAEAADPTDIAARRDLRLSVAANSMRLDHGPDHERHEMWAAMAQLLNRLADLAPYWHEPYAAPFVPIIEAGLHVAVAYEEARNGT